LYSALKNFQEMSKENQKNVNKRATDIFRQFFGVFEAVCSKEQYEEISRAFIPTPCENFHTRIFQDVFQTVMENIKEEFFQYQSTQNEGRVRKSKIRLGTRATQNKH